MPYYTLSEAAIQGRRIRNQKVDSSHKYKKWHKPGAVTYDIKAVQDRHWEVEDPTRELGAVQLEKVIREILKQTPAGEELQEELVEIFLQNLGFTKTAKDGVLT